MNALAIALSVPVFFAAIGLELIGARARGVTLYRLTDAISSLSCGVVQQATAIFLRVVVIGAYAVIAEHGVASAWFVPSSVAAWAVLMVLVDHQYYWFHRASHRVNVFWAAHVVHHQSEEYNLSTALRQSAAQGFVSAMFYWPIALLGVPTEMFIAAITANTLYQFWIHTRLIGKLGPLEWVLNTPSHHRVHHAIDPRYIDKNYGGISIVWDRLYGTFAEEREAPSYGTVKPLNSFNPLWANLEVWASIGRLMRGASTWRERLWAPLAPPEWRPAAMGGVVVIPPVERARRLYDVVVPRSLQIYVACQFAVVGLVLVAQLLLSGGASALSLAAMAGWICASTAAWGGLFERKRWAMPLELARQITLPLVVWQRREDLVTLARDALDGDAFVLAAAVIAALSLVHLFLLRSPLHREPTPA